MESKPNYKMSKPSSENPQQPINQKLLRWHHLNQSKKRTKISKHTKSVESLNQAKPSINILSKKLGEKQKESQQYKDFLALKQRKVQQLRVLKEQNKQPPQPYRVIRMPVQMKLDLKNGIFKSVDNTRLDFWESKKPIEGVELSDLKYRFDNPWLSGTEQSMIEIVSLKSKKKGHTRSDSLPTTDSFNKSNVVVTKGKYQKLAPTQKQCQFSIGFDLKRFEDVAKPVVSYSNIVSR